MLEVQIGEARRNLRHNRAANLRPRGRACMGLKVLRPRGPRLLGEACVARATYVTRLLGEALDAVELSEEFPPQHEIADEADQAFLGGLDRLVHPQHVRVEHLLPDVHLRGGRVERV